MPKNRKVTKTATGGKLAQKVPSKLRIGPRKGGKSALLMSKDELVEILNNKDKSRYHSKVVAALRARNQWPEWPEPLVRTADTTFSEGNSAAN